MPINQNKGFIRNAAKSFVARESSFALLRMTRTRKISKTSGFTLLEILIALFIFTILSIMLVGALHTVINAQSGTEKSAERLRQLQMVLLIMSRDIEQTANRPATDASGKVMPAFVGDQHSFTFTHLGLANPMSNIARSTMQRTSYAWDQTILSRTIWDAVDQAPTTRSHTRQLLTDVSEAYFEYIDKDGKPHQVWPVEGQNAAPLPRAVRIYLTIAQWGKMSQLYIVPVVIADKAQTSSSSGSSDQSSTTGQPSHDASSQ